METPSIHRHLYENAPLGYHSLDINGYILHINKKWLESLGYTRNEVIGKHFTEFIHPKDVFKFKENFPRFLEEGECFNVEYRLVRKDESLILASINGVISYDEKGHFIQTHCIFRDITIEKEINEQYRALVKNSLQGIALMQNGRLIFVNEKYSKITGYSKEELLNLSPEEIINTIHPKDRDLVSKRMADRLARKNVPSSYEFRGIKKDGSVFVIEIYATVVTHQNRPAIQIALNDITKRKEIQLENIKMFDDAPIGIILSTMNYRQFKVNDAICQMTGYSREELLQLTFKEFTHSDDLDRSNGMTQKLYEGKIKSFSMEKRYVKKNKKSFWARTHVTILRDDLDNPLYYMVMIQDISPKKKIEKETKKQLLRYSINDGELYLVTDAIPIIAYNSVNDLCKIGYTGIIFSRLHELELREYIDDMDCKMYWLAEKDETAMPPDYKKLMAFIEKKKPNSVILIDRLDYLISTIGFEETLQFIYVLKEIVYLNNLIVIITVDKATLTKQELTLLTKESKEIQPRFLAQLSSESLEILRLIFQLNNAGKKPFYTEVGSSLQLSRPTTRKRVRELVATGFIIETRRGSRKELEVSQKTMSIFTQKQ